MVLKSDRPEGFGDAEVSQLEQLVGGDEDVLRLDVAMQDVLLVEVLQREADLNKPVSNLGLKTRKV
jgi:hypothetical protein